MTRVMKSSEIESEYGLSAELIDKWAKDAANGLLHGEVRKTLRGRPFKFGEETRQVGFKEPISKIAIIDLRADQLGYKRSDYLRALVDADLVKAGMMPATE